MEKTHPFELVVLEKNKNEIFKIHETKETVDMEHFNNDFEKYVFLLKFKPSYKLLNYEHIEDYFYNGNIFEVTYPDRTKDLVMFSVKDTLFGLQLITKNKEYEDIHKTSLLSDCEEVVPFASFFKQVDIYQGKMNIVKNLFAVCNIREFLNLLNLNVSQINILLRIYNGNPNVRIYSNGVEYLNYACLDKRTDLLNFVGESNFHVYFIHPLKSNMRLDMYDSRSFHVYTGTIYSIKEKDEILSNILFRREISDILDNLSKNKSYADKFKIQNEFMIYMHEDGLLKFKSLTVDVESDLKELRLVLKLNDVYDMIKPNLEDKNYVNKFLKLL